MNAESANLKSAIDCSTANLATMDYSHAIKNGADMPGDHYLDADVVIIGAGAGGAACAYQLTKITDLKVVVLEAGPYVPLTQLNHDLLDMMDALAWQSSNDGAEDGSLRVVHGRCVGGSTMLHMLTMTELSSHVLGQWQSKGLTNMTVENLESYVDELKKLMNIKRIDRSQVNRNAEPWIAGCENLGHFWQLNQRNAGNCIGAGRCHTGCPFGGKVSMDVSLIPHALNQGLELYSRAMVERIESHAGQVTGVSVVTTDSHGRPHGRMTVRADQVVVAAGAIQTPGLLLRSKLQSRDATVGRQLFVQPGINMLGLMPEPVMGWRGITNPIHIDQWAQRTQGGFFIEPGMLDASINADFVPGTGTEHRQRMLQYSHMTAGQILYADHGQFNRVTWNRNRADVTFKLSGEDHQHMRFAIKKAAEILLSGGARAAYVGQRQPLEIKSTRDLQQIETLTFEPKDIHFESVHVHGSCPMGRSAKEAVVDETGACFHVKNLYIADASILPTPICMNTTIPSATMGMWVADRMI